MAPEQLLDAASADERSDVWSLGIVLYELLSGRPPYEGASTADVCAKVLAAPLPSLMGARPDVPPELASIVARCLERDLERRYPRVADLARDLRAVIARCSE